MARSALLSRLAKLPALARVAQQPGAARPRQRRQASHAVNDAQALPAFLGGRRAPAAAASRFLAGLGLIQRQCACGGSGPAPCEECAAPGGLLQPKLALSRPGDAFEQEADRAAEAVLAGRGVPALSAAPIATTAVQAKGDGGPAHEGSAQAAQAVHSGGRPLSAGEQAFFEPRFGRDLSAVRVHTDGSAGLAARAIHATAYTLGNHIAFAPGSYQPDTEAGQSLMAHELAHTLQQGRGEVIRRTCPVNGGKEPQGAALRFEARAWAIRQLPSYQKLKAEEKALAEHIIDGARGSACPNYYIDKLYALFNTTEQNDDEQVAQGAAEIQTAKKAETARVAEVKKQMAAGKVKEDTTKSEEKIAGDPARVWTERVGEGGKMFYVDARDASNIVVRIRVRLTAFGRGTAADVQGIKALEDGIEKAASTRGYTFDIQFVETSGPDVFEANVDTSDWTTSGNWVGDVKTMAHEAHHLLGLADRYNYIESHAENAGMEIGTRLYWFREQMVRGQDSRSRQTMMADHTAYPFDDLDVCAVASEKADFARCVHTRIRSRPMDDLARLGRELMQHYEPQNAAMLRLMADAWQSQCFTRYPEQRDAPALNMSGKAIGQCWVNDCRNPPEDAFGKTHTWPALLDEWNYPLRNPHDQPEGSTLKRESAPWWMPSP